MTLGAVPRGTIPRLSGRRGRRSVSYQARPHVSSALAHLRAGVIACAAVFGLSLAGHVVIWSLVHFTEARTTQAGRDEPPPPLRVVESAGKGEATPSPRELAEGPPLAEVNVVPGEADIFLRRGTMLVHAAGVISAMLWVLLVAQGVVIAGGAGVPGVQKVISASTLAGICALAALPLWRAMPELDYRGVFISYRTLVEQSLAVRQGGPDASPMALYAQHLLLPLALLAGVITSVMRFLSGIEAGFIVQSVSELDERIEREIRAAKLGQLASPRAVGALNAALGEVPHTAQPSRPSAYEPVPVAPPAFRGATDPPIETYKPGDSTRRPI